MTEVLHMVSHVRRRFSSFLEASISSPLAVIYCMDQEAYISDVVASCSRFTRLLCIVVASAIPLQLLITKSI